MEFTIKENTFKADKLNIFEQFKVARKLSPLIGEFFSKMEVRGLSKISGNNEEILKAILPVITQYIAELPDNDVNEIIYPCLSVVKIKQGSTYSAIFNKQSKTMMFDDISMFDMLTIVYYVIKDSLGNFFQELQGNPLTVERAVQLPTE